MWRCRKCNEPVYFAERKQSLGFDWHPKCLRCEECGKRLNPGQHAEHKGVPYCHHPCYGALFGPQLFGHGTRNECHTSFGKVENRDGQIKRSHLENRLKSYNQYYEGKPGELKSREVNGRLILEGVLRIYWGVTNIIHLKEEDDHPLSPPRQGVGGDSDSDGENYHYWRDSSPNPPMFRSLHNPSSSTTSTTTTPPPPTRTQAEGSTTSNIDHDYSSNRETNGNCNTLPPSADSKFTPHLTNGHSNGNLNNGSPVSKQDPSGSTPRRGPGSGLRRRPGRRMDKAKLKRRCSINGHWYLRETSSFKPPHGCSCSIWASSLVTAAEVVHLVLEKYKVDMNPCNFALYVVKDTGEQRRLRDDEYPLEARVLLGPHEEVARIFIMDCNTTQEISPQVADFINLSWAECQAIISKYNQEEQRQLKNLQQKYADMRMYIERRLRQLQRGV